MNTKTLNPGQAQELSQTPCLDVQPAYRQLLHVNRWQTRSVDKRRFPVQSRTRLVVAFFDR